MHFPKENAARRRLNCERTAADVVVRRRNRAPGGRPTNCMVALSEEEAALIREAAERDNMALGAWVGEAAVRSARNKVLPTSSTGEAMQGLMMMRAEAAELRRLLKIAGGNLNDVARWANSTGKIHAATQKVLARVGTVTEQAAELIGGYDQAVRLLRDDLLSERRRRRRGRGPRA